MSTDLTAEEFGESLTGFEEIAITKRFGSQFSDLPGTIGVRAMVFVDLSRGEMSADDAYNEAMSKPLGSLNGYFRTDDEITPEAPTTDTGKGDLPDDETPMS